MTAAPDMLKSFVDRLERIEAEVRELNGDKSDIYHEAKGQGFDVAALKAVVAYRRKDPAKACEQLAIFETYLAAVQGRETKNNAPAATPAPKEGHPDEPAPTRVHAHEAGEDIPTFLDRRRVA